MTEHPEASVDQTAIESLSAKAESSELEKLPPELSQTVATLIASFSRFSSGPDPETARVIAESEMHSENCKLEAYKASLASSDEESKLDHDYRVKTLNRDTAKEMLVSLVSIGGVICGLYLVVAKGNSQVGTPILVASFMALLRMRPEIGKDKE